MLYIIPFGVGIALAPFVGGGTGIALVIGGIVLSIVYKAWLVPLVAQKKRGIKQEVRMIF
jgi:hypothetical protein